uniref:PX domain-containing protein n=2 Tax=Clastoptera arizonana TaxID=38151 RepID=A0A1B6D3M3_9HEMI
MNNLSEYKEEELNFQIKTGQLTVGVEAKESSDYIQPLRDTDSFSFHDREMDVSNFCNDLKFEVVSARTIDFPKKHVTYRVEVRKDYPELDTQPNYIERRYTEFLDLYKSLCIEFPTIMSSISFPKKALMGNFTQEMISSRSASFQSFLKLITENEQIKNSNTLINFLQDKEQQEAYNYIIDKKYDQAVPLLENCFRMINKIQTDRHPEVLRSLCLLVACCEANKDPQAEYFAEIALHRYEAVSDVDLLKYYVPLLELCVHLYWSSGRDKTFIEERLSRLKRCGMKVGGNCTLLDMVLADKVF